MYGQWKLRCHCLEPQRVSSDNQDWNEDSCFFVKILDEQYISSKGLEVSLCKRDQCSQNYLNIKNVII